MTGLLGQLAQFAQFQEKALRLINVTRYSTDESPARFSYGFTSRYKKLTDSFAEFLGVHYPIARTA